MFYRAEGATIANSAVIGCAHKRINMYWHSASTQLSQAKYAYHTLDTHVKSCGVELSIFLQTIELRENYK